MLGSVEGESERASLQGRKSLLLGTEEKPDPHEGRPMMSS
jgi:hypothetical protein